MGSIEPTQKIKRTKAEKKALYRNDYPEPIKSRREHLKAVMNNPDCDKEYEARELIFQYFEEDSANNRVNMYTRTVEMIKAMPDRGKTSGESLAEWYLKFFGEWLKQEPGREEELRAESLNASIQMDALKVCSVAQKALLCEVFHITQEKLIENITELMDSAVKKQEYHVAAEMAIQYNLTGRYKLNQLALPLLLREKDQLAFNVMRGHVKMQRELVQFLDEFSGASVSYAEQMLEPWILDKVMTKPSSRYVGKALDRLIKTVTIANVTEYDFDPNLDQYAPKFFLNKNMKHLKFNITERYDGRRSDENYFQDMVQTLKSDPNVREPILHFLWDSDNTEKRIDAISLALYLGCNFPSSPHLPGKMKDFFRSPDHRLQEAKDLLERRKETQETSEHGTLYVNEEEKLHRIYMVRNETEMNEICDQLELLSSKPDPVYVGFDSEWKPSNITSNNETKIAIIQLFFNGSVWLVDCIELEKTHISHDYWQKLADRLFMNTKLKIIGFDMRNDLDAIVTIPALRSFLKVENIKNCFDLKRLAENICDVDMEILDLAKKTFKLADLTQHLLGRTLDKTEQCSNWQCRPLRKKQIIYAAMDAIVVVETYQKILEVTLEKEPSFNIKKVELDSNVAAPKKVKDSKSVRKLKFIPWKEIYETLRHRRDERKPPQKPHQVQVIVDTMLLGFGKHLRRCGIDVYLPKDVADFRAKLKLIARLGGEFKRHIITVPSKSYDALKQEYQRSLISIPDLNTMAPLDQLVAFFDLFNIELEEDDEYLRCVDCNSRLQIKFPGPVLHFLHQYCVIHLQNIYRPDMNDFPLEEWWNRMQRINPADYDGVEVKMSRPNPKSKWIVATVPTGCLHITRQTAIHNNLPDGVEVYIEKVPDDEFQRPNVCFYVCGDCGAVAYDGHIPPNNSIRE